MARAFLTNEQKLLLRAHWAAQPQLSSADAADWVRAQFHVSVSRSTLYRIAQAPAHAFAGSLHRKKRRRVKFPAFEHELLAFCLAAPWSSTSTCTDDGHSSTEPHVRTADTLARKAVELRAKHGIAPDALKLSNGWMHKFKERHCLTTTAPFAVRGLEAQTSHVSDEDASNEAAPAGEQTSQATAPPPAPPVDSAASTPVPARSSSATRPLEESLPPPPTVSPPAPELTVSVPVATPVPPSPAPRRDACDASSPTQQHRPPIVRPLVHITAKALSAVRSPGMLNWEPCARQQPSAAHFAIVDSGIQVQRAGVYQINVDVEHTSGCGSASAPSDSAEVFRISHGTERLASCTSVLRRDASGVALSVAQVQCALPASACVRVAFAAPGFALPSSRIVIRWVHDDSGSRNQSCTSGVPSA